MNQEQCLKASILQKRSPKGIRGFRWQKRMFRLYHDKIVYSAIQTDLALGEIPLICVTKIVEYPDKQKNRFNIVMGAFRIFELQAPTSSVAQDWIQILRASITNFSHLNQEQCLKQQIDRFWNIDSNITTSVHNNFEPQHNANLKRKHKNSGIIQRAATMHDGNNNSNSTGMIARAATMHDGGGGPSPRWNSKQAASSKHQSHNNIHMAHRHGNANSTDFTFNNNTPDPSQPPYQNANHFRRGGPPSPIEEGTHDTNSDPGRYDGYQEQLDGHTQLNKPTTPMTAIPSSTSTKLTFSKLSKKAAKPDKKHRRGAQSNKFWARDPRNLKSRTDDKEKEKETESKLEPDTLAISKSHSLRADEESEKDSRRKAPPKLAKHSLQRSASANELPSPTADDNSKNIPFRPAAAPQHQRGRLSVMDTILPSDINAYKVEEEFYALPVGTDASNNHGEEEAIPPFGKVAIVSTDESEAPYLLQVSNKSDRNYHKASAVMDRMGYLINPYLITQLQRGDTSGASWATYNCPSNGCLTNCLHLFRNVSVTSVRILIAEIICGLEYLHENNFNFPNLSPETVYISHKSHIILTDFGFALPNDDAMTYRCGPLCYAPPEFLMKGVDDLKSDWWRLGVLIYHLIMGKPPFTGDREHVCEEICTSLINKNTLFPPPNDFNAEIADDKQAQKLQSPRSQQSNLNDMEIEVDEATKDLILRLLCRDRKERLGCRKPSSSAQDKGKFGRKGKTHFGINEILHHPFFECIWNKKNRDYQYTWSNIRKREHEPAPILRHLATRATDSPRERAADPNSKDEASVVDEWKDEYDDDLNDNDNAAHKQSMYQNDNGDIDIDDQGSIVDTTDDEEYDDEDENSRHGSMSLPGTTNAHNNSSVPAPILPPINDEMGTNIGSLTSNSGNNQMQPGSLSGSSPMNATSPYSLSQNTPLNNNGNSNNQKFFPPPPGSNSMNGLSPLLQSPTQERHPSMGSAHSRASTALPPVQHMSYPPPPAQSPRFGGVPNPNPNQNQNQNAAASQPQSSNRSRPITPIASQYQIRPKAKQNLNAQKRQSGGFVPNRKLPPPPPSKQLPPPKLAQSQSQPQDEAENDVFSQYVQHQQMQMQMAMDVPPPPIDSNYVGATVTPPIIGNHGNYVQTYAPPRLDNLHDQEDRKPVTDASTIVSDQIAAAAALRQPILTEAQRIKQQKKEEKKLKKKQKRMSKMLKKKGGGGLIDEAEMKEIMNERNTEKDGKPKPKQKEKEKERRKESNLVTEAKRGSHPTKKTGMGFDKIHTAIRSKVSKKKRRFIDKVNNFNLDLTYVTKRIIAMGYPAEGKEAYIRNPASEVIRFFDTYHKGRFKVYNLCIEKDRQYSPALFTSCGGECAKYGFKDHNSPELELILKFCQDLHEWLSRNRDNVAAIHCKAGKGRTGVMICAYLAYSKICRNAGEALLKYGQARTKNAKGVTIPSQRRYVLYFANYVMNPDICLDPDKFAFHRICILKRVRMNTIPDFDIGGGCDPYFIIVNTKGQVLYDYSAHHPVKAHKGKKRAKKPKKSKSKKKDKKGKHDNLNSSSNTTGPPPMDPDETVKFRGLDIILRGSFKVIFYDKDVLSSDDIMCWCWLHSSVVARQKYVYLPRDEIDGAVKDKAYKHFPGNFSLEFWFDTPVDEITETESVIHSQPNLNDWMISSPTSPNFRGKQHRQTAENNASFHGQPPPPQSLPQPQPQPQSLRQPVPVPQIQPQIQAQAQAQAQPRPHQPGPPGPPGVSHRPVPQKKHKTSKKQRMAYPNPQNNNINNNMMNNAPNNGNGMHLTQQQHGQRPNLMNGRNAYSGDTAMNAYPPAPSTGPPPKPVLAKGRNAYSGDSAVGTQQPVYNSQFKPNLPPLQQSPFPQQNNANQPQQAMNQYHQNRNNNFHQNTQYQQKPPVPNSSNNNYQHNRQSSGNRTPFRPSQNHNAFNNGNPSYNNGSNFNSMYQRSSSNQFNQNANRQSSNYNGPTNSSLAYNASSNQQSNYNRPMNNGGYASPNKFKQYNGAQSNSNQNTNHMAYHKNQANMNGNASNHSTQHQGQYTNHHYQNGRPLQPPPIATDSSMMDTLRQNMQHHLENKTDAIPKKKTFI